MKKIYYYIIGIILCFYGLNNYVDIFINILLCAFLVTHIRDKNFEYLFLGLIFFEPILTLPFSGGSFFRLYEILFLVKVVLDIRENKAKLKLSKYIILSGLFIIVTGFFYQGISEQISLIINTLIMIYIICKEDNNNEFYDEMLYVIGVLISFTAIYGFFRGKILNYGSFNRMSTTISDPNYAALFLNIGFFSILGNKKCEKTEKKVLLTVLGIALLCTVSLTGICGCLFLIIVYCFLNSFKKGFKYSFVLLILLIAFIIAPIKQGNVLFGIHQRLLNIEDSSVDEISSGRTILLKNYLEGFYKLPIRQFLIGGNNTISGEYRQSVTSEFSNVSHNSYIDMLYMIGIIGLVVFLIIYIYGLVILKRQINNGKKIAINFIIIKILLVYFAFTISIFPFRYFIMIFLINIQQKGENKKNESSLDSQHNISISS